MADNNTQLAALKLMLGDDASEYSDDLLNAYLSLASDKIIKKRFPFDKTQTILPTQYDKLQVELACVYASQSGIEGESSHTEGSVTRTYRSEGEIMRDVIPYVGIPS